MKPSAVALNKKPCETRVGRLWAQRPGVANAFAPPVTSLRLFSRTMSGYRDLLALPYWRLTTAFGAGGATRAKVRARSGPAGRSHRPEGGRSGRRRHPPRVDTVRTPPVAMVGGAEDRELGRPRPEDGPHAPGSTPRLRNRLEPSTTQVPPPFSGAPPMKPVKQINREFSRRNDRSRAGLSSRAWTRGASLRVESLEQRTMLTTVTATDPAAGSLVQPPAAITVRFSQPVDPTSKIWVCPRSSPATSPRRSTGATEPSPRPGPSGCPRT